MAFSFVCHTALLPIYTELKVQTKAQMSKVSLVSIATSWTFYFVAAVFAYATFFQGADGNILNNYPLKSVTIEVVNIAFGFAVVLTVPVIVFPLRRAINKVAFRNRPFSWLRHMTITITVVTIVTAMALLVPGLEDVFAVAGATSSVSIMLILPGFLYYKLNPKPHPKRTFAVCFACFGILLGVVCLSSVIYSFIRGDS